MPPARSNVLFIAVDDLRPELACYGAEHIKSPNIDRLAAQGTLFRRAYCQQAVCNPSRASLMTGLRPDSVQVWDLPTHFRDKRPDVITIPQHFKQHGYHSQGMGKIYHLGHGNRDDKLSWSVSHQTPSLGHYRRLRNQRILRDNRAAARRNPQQRISNGPPAEAAPVADNAYKDGATTDLAIKTLSTIKDEPFFLAVGYSKPHLPFCAPQRYWDLYDEEDIELPANNQPPKDAPEFALTSWGELRKYHGVPNTGPLSETQARRLIHGYYACVSYVDAQIGRLLAELDRLGLRDNTVVVLWGDHGWKLGEYGCWCKHTNFEYDTNAPLIISAPGQRTRGGRTDALVEFIDIYPTLCELCGLELPGHVEGTSLVPLLNDSTLPGKKAALSQYPRRGLMGYSLRTGRYRYTEWRDRKTDAITARELYDHNTDPGETINVADDPRQTTRRMELSRLLGQIRAS